MEIHPLSSGRSTGWCYSISQKGVGYETVCDGSRIAESSSALTVFNRIQPASLTEPVIAAALVKILTDATIDANARLWQFHLLEEGSEILL